jgi:SOS-response transcriptional repressor LexA
MDTLGTQIKKYREFRNLTQKQLAEKLGERSGSVIYNWEKGIGRPDCDKLVRLCDVLDISADELLCCKSMAQHPTTTEWTTLQKYRALDEHGKEVVDYLIDSEYKRVTALTKKPKARMLKVDFYNYPASAGTGSFLDNETPQKIFVPETEEAEQADFVIPICGDSMEPTYHDGDRVLVERRDTIQPGEIGIFVLNGEAYIKELGNRCLISHNAAYKPIKIGADDSIICCGKVIGVIRE